MKFVVIYVLLGVGVCLWTLTALLRQDREGEFDAYRQTFGNKGVWRILGVLALLAGICWPCTLFIRAFVILFPSRWFMTKNDDDDDLPPPNQENAA